uniref:Reverse transcriptase domain-containing protein n=1 Tax=Tanacetum cinerariifolium TaxID=118510 RepID=A0A6L2KGL6_TANCI|nr:reverse transcriptase domain-containing protein [Tanacetum cinerariifolium]
MPNNVKTYDESDDLEDHLKIFQATVKVERWAMPTWYHMFNSTLTGSARQKKSIKDLIKIHHIKQREGESMENFMQRFKAESRHVKGAPKCMRIFEFMHEITNPELIKRMHDNILVLVDKIMRITIAFLWEEVEASKHARKKAPSEKKMRAEGPMIIEAEIGGHFIHRIYVDGGSTSEILYEHCFNRLRSEVKNQMVLATTPLIGFSGEIIWPMGQILLPVKIGDAKHFTSTWMNFMVVKPSSPYNGIIGRPRVRKIQAVPSTAYKMLKFSVLGGVLTLWSSKIIQLDCTMVSGPRAWPSDVIQATEERIKVAIHLEYLEQIITIGSTLIEEGRKALCDLLRHNLDVFTWKPADMTGVLRHIAKHRLNVSEGCSPKCIKKSDFQWTTKAEAAFKEIKNLIAELPTLTAPIEKEEFIMYLAAAWKAVSAGLLTKREAKQMQVCFVSRALQGPDINHTSIEKLMLALVHASKQLKRYLQAHTIIVIINKPIKQILSKPEVAGRLQKWSIELVERLEDDSLDAPMETEEELLDPWTQFVDGSFYIDGSGAGLMLTNPKGAEFTYALRFKFDATNNKAEYEALIAGLRIREQMGHACRIKVHGSKGHTDRILLANDAHKCKKIDKGMPRLPSSLPYAKKPAAKIESHHVPRPFYKWGIDIAGPFPKGPGKVKFLIVEMDYFTKWIEAKPVATIIGNEVKKFVWDNIVCRFGLPEEIIFDNEKQFRDKPFKNWCEKLCIRQCFAFVKHPQANGLVERANKSLREGIKVRPDERSKDWIKELPYVLWAHRIMIMSSNRDTPFSLTYGTKAVIPAKIGMPLIRTSKVDILQNDEALEINLDLLEERREQAAICEAKSKAKIEKYYNFKVRNISFKPGDLVYRSNEASHAKRVGSLAPSGKDYMK